MFRSILLTLCIAAALLKADPIHAQSVPVVDCACVSNLPELKTNACQAVIPDLCLLATNCFSSNVVISPGFCSQTPPAGTVVGPGTHYITLTVLDNQGLADQCLVPFLVSPAPGCTFTLLCATNKTVECGSAWNFDPPTWTNNCAPPLGTPSNGVTLTMVSTVTNGACPEVITVTWQAVDDCGYHDQCSQTITVVDTTPPKLDCNCLTNPAVFPVALTVTACATNIPDLCLPARFCASDACGVAGCLQSPPAGTPVGVGVHPITVQVYDCASNAASCVVNFTVLAPAGGCNTNPCAPPPSGMVGWWPLDETCGAPLFADITGTGNAAIVESGGPVCSPFSPNAVPGKVAGANYFFGPTVRGRAPNAPSINFGTSSFSMDCWVNPVLTGPVHWHPIIDKLQQNGPFALGYKVALLNAQVVLVVGDGTPYTYTSVGTVTYGAWNFVGVSVDRTANTVTFHVNGVTEPPQPLLPAGGFNSPVDLLIGGTHAVANPYGELAIDELELFKQALTHADFNPIWQADALGKCRPQPCTNSVISIYCPPDTNVQTCASSAIVSFPPALATTSCGTITNLTAVPPSGSAFPAGTNIVTWTAYDALGNSNSCTFLVIVTPDRLPPTCPPSTLSVTGCPPVMPNFATNSLVTDNCAPPGSITVTQSIPPGTPLTNSPTVVVLNVCDSAGNCNVCTVSITPVLAPGCCQPAPVLRLFSGATNNLPGVLPGGAFDPQFLTGPPLFSTVNPYVPFWITGWWVPNSALSKWVGPFANFAAGPGGVYYYTNRFFLCSTNQASVTGRWTADDTGRIFLNGAPTANVLPNGWAFTNWHPVSITAGLVPGWNTLVFAVTNGGYSLTGLRTEINASACCDTCINIACPPGILTNTCSGGVAITYPAPAASSSCGNIVSVTSSPPSGSVFPVGTNVVTCTAIDSQGNAATCSFNVIVQRIGNPVTIKCPPDQILYTCGSNAVAYYKVFATGQTGPVITMPPSGSTFPLGTNIVTSYATNACGDVAICTFKIILKPYLIAGPNMTYQAGLADNFALPFDPASTNACMVASVSGYGAWKKFDTVAVNTLFGHRFTGLPNNIVQAQLITRMKPANDGTGVGIGSDNDGLFIGLTNCAPGGWAYVASIKALPGAGGNWFPNHPPTTFTNNLSAAVIAHMNATQLLDVMVHDDTTVDYMTLRLWVCPPPLYPNGNWPHWTKSGPNPPSAVSVMPQVVLPAFGPIGPGPAFCVSPPNGNPALPNSIELGLGGGQAFGFTTLLDMNAPEDAEILVSVPTEDGTNAPLFRIVKGKCPPNCHWDIKPAKKFFDDGGAFCRVSAVSTNGDLLDSFVVSQAEAETDSLLSLAPEPGVDQFPVSFLIDATTGEISVTFPGTTARRLCNGLPCPRGWDGTIKGLATEAARRRGWDGTVKCPCFDDEASRVVFTPSGGGGLLPPTLEISSIGLADLVIIGERLYAIDRQVSPQLDGAVAFQGAAGGDGLSFTPLEDYSGIRLDLGRAASFDLGIHHFENGDIPTQEQIFRIGGPKFPPGTTTNRPPPPPIFDLRIFQSGGGVYGAVDFSPLGATGILVQLYSNGVYTAYGQAPLGAILPEDPLPLGRWPERLSFTCENNVLRLTCSEFFDVAGFLCDELRFTPDLPPGSPTFEFASEIECLATAATETLLFGLQRVVACAPTAMNISTTPDGAAITWSGEGYRLLGAEKVDGPWIDLGVASPFILAPHAPQRYFRLVCD